MLEGKVYAQLRSIGNEATDLATSLALNSSLTKLDLTGSNVGNDGLNIIANAIRKHPTLRKLVFNDTQLIGVVEQLDTLLRYNSMLEELHLARNKLGDEGVKTVMCTQVDFCCDDLGLSVEFVVPLIVNTGLQFVDVSENGITQVGATTIAEVLQANTHLKTLNLASNMLGSQGKREAFICRPFNTNPALYRSGNHCQGFGVKLFPYCD